MPIIKLLILLITLTSSTVNATAVITETKDSLGWKIETASSTYQIAVADDNIVIPVYYGPKGNMTEILEPAIVLD
jgi:hypothetical protein